MTPSEFKAWFEIDGRPVTERVFVDHYIERHWPRYPQYLEPYWSCGHIVPLNTTCGSHENSFNSHHAMLALGRADAASLS